KSSLLTKNRINPVSKRSKENLTKPRRVLISAASRVRRSSSRGNSSSNNSNSNSNSSNNSKSNSNSSNNSKSNSNSSSNSPGSKTRNSLPNRSMSSSK
ncbi:MAG: hypothetical protein WAW24_02825, partial [Bacteroidales bacterium]